MSETNYSNDENINKHGVDLTDLEVGESYTAYIGEKDQDYTITEGSNHNGWERVEIKNIDHENNEYLAEHDGFLDTHEITLSGDEIKPKHINPHGLNLNEVEVGDWYTVENTGDGRRQAEIKYINRDRNLVGIEYNAMFAIVKELADMNDLRPHVTQLDDHISLDEFNDLDPGDGIVAYIKGFGKSTLVYVESVDHEDETVEVRGILSRYGDRTIHRDIPRELIARLED